MRDSRERHTVLSGEARASREHAAFETHDAPTFEKHALGPPGLPGGGKWEDAKKVFWKKPWKNRGPKNEPPDPFGHYYVGIGGILLGTVALYLPAFLAGILVPFLIGFGSMRVIQGILAGWANPESIASWPGYLIMGSGGTVMTFVLQSALAFTSPYTLLGALAIGLYAGTLQLRR